MRLTTIFIFSILSFINFAWAGYDKTEWGMTLAKVKTLYPGGVVKKEQDGSNSYSIIKPVAGATDGYLTFYFQPNIGLEHANVLIPAAGSPINLKTGDYKAMLNLECPATFKNLKDSLIKKYGAATLSDSETVGWLVESKDLIMLNIVRPPADPTHCTVGIHYSKYVEPPDTKGH